MKRNNPVLTNGWRKIRGDIAKSRTRVKHSKVPKVLFSRNCVAKKVKRPKKSV